jgi:outer membrane porin, OprD family
MLLAFSGVEQAAVAQPNPSPTASPTPAPKSTSNPFTVSGRFRAYDFTRQNASGFPSTASQLNQQSINFATLVNLNYRILNSGFSVGASYIYANPLNGCYNPHSTSFNCATLTSAQAPGHLNPDTTLPGYGMSGLYEAYLEYQKNGWYAKIGDQVINTPWTNASDTRMKPNAFEGADVSYQLTPHVTLEAMDMTRYQPRTSTDFLQETLLTGALTELPGTTNPPANTGGFQYGSVGYVNGNLTSDLDFYHFDNIANFAWLDGKYTFTHARFKPYIAWQAGDEKNTGASEVGQIDSQVIGAQLGVNVTKNLLFTAGVDVIPRHVANLPAGDTCNVGTGQITPAQTYPNSAAGYYEGVNAPECFRNPNGTYSVEYGGLASPYTYSYATDPLFTTSLTQGMADRGAPGSSEKLALTYTSNDKRLVLMVSQAYYDYGYSNFPDQTAEANADATYYFRKRPGGTTPYRGLFLRYRYGVRTDDHSSALNYPAIPGVYFGGLPYFVYNRAQIEYDF